VKLRSFGGDDEQPCPYFFLGNVYLPPSLDVLDDLFRFILPGMGKDEPHPPVGGTIDAKLPE